MLPQLRANTVEMNGKVECQPKKKKENKEEPNRDIRKNAITKNFKIQLNRLNSKMEMTEESISELENKAIEITNLNNNNNKNLKS